MATGKKRLFRTLHINTERTWRGGELQALLLLRGLRELGHTAELVCPPGSPLAERARAAGVRSYLLPLRGEVDLLSALRLRRLLRSGGYDVLHAHTSHGHTLAVMSAFALPVRLVVSRRVDFSIFRRSFLGLNLWKYRFGFDRIIAVSEAVKRVLVRNGVPEHRIRVVRSGIDPNRFNGIAPRRAPPADLGIPPAAPLIVNVAHLTPHKGQIYLIRAFLHVLKAFPDAYLCIVGQGELLEELRTEARALGIGDRVRLPGFRNDVEAILAAASVYVMSSVEEGLGTAVLDALCAGVPVVATQAGGLPEIITQNVNGLLVPPASPEDLAHAVLQLLRSTHLRSKLVEAGRKTVLERFTYRRTVQGTVAVYEELCERGSNR